MSNPSNLPTVGNPWKSQPDGWEPPEWDGGEDMGESEERCGTWSAECSRCYAPGSPLCEQCQEAMQAMAQEYGQEVPQ